MLFMKFKVKMYNFIFQNDKKYEEAIKLYNNALKCHPNMATIYAHLGVCFIKIGHFRGAFSALQNAKIYIQDYDYNFDPKYKEYIDQVLDTFEKEGQLWRQNSSIRKQQKKILLRKRKQFRSTFQSMYEDIEKQAVCRQKVLKEEILNIILLLQQDQFKMHRIDEIFKLIEKAISFNAEYFHIIPQLFIEYFYDNVLLKHKPTLEVQRYLMNIIKRISSIRQASQEKKQPKEAQKNAVFKMKNFDPPSSNRVNLFKEYKYFNSYEEVYSEIIKINNKAKQSYADFKSLVDKVKKRSNEQLYGIGMKIPTDQQHQFKVFLRIFEKMFKQELTPQNIENIISKIDQNLQRFQKNEETTEMIDVIKIFMDTWTSELTAMVQARKRNQVETKFEISDLLRGKLLFTSVDKIKMAVKAIDDICKQKRYQVIQMNNRLMKKQTQDVVFKIKIKEAVCEFQLALKQEQSEYNLTHFIYELQRSSLGCIFGSYVFMSKGVEYHFIENCYDIIELLKDSQDEKEKKIVQATRYVVESLTHQKKELQ